ncbi:recombination protein NinB [Aquamicrobium sp. LC103]|uniref:recombination protein NinB n=1 Tax=Aquamicrobium sp. LC103 TaxID=1120658 RepID=UPI0009E31F9D|nr:recombination protein NinB [Aquamicrobium sp. LC103]TKT80027.1 hypothetical protein XW59_006610 [Aquamicrobium sp. LC103]
MSRAVIVINGNYDRDRASQWARGAPTGCIIEFKQSKRTLDQNARLWACLTEIARKVDWYGQKLPADDWKDVFTAALRRTRVVPGIDAGTFVPLGMRTSDMTKQEFSDLLELINAFAAERGITFDDADENSSAAPSADEEGSGQVAPSPSAPDSSALPGDEGEAEQVEAGDGPTAGSASPDPVKSELQRECIDNMIRAATDADKAKREELVSKAYTAWLKELPDDEPFVKRVFETCCRLVEDQSQAETARKYLMAKVA